VAVKRRRDNAEVLTYSGPVGTHVPDPSLDLLEEVILRHDPARWERGSGSSGLMMTVREGPKSFRTLPDLPSLVFFLVSDHGFCFTCFEPGRRFPTQWVTFTGGEPRPWVEHSIGGDSIYYPKACFVPRPQAWEVVQHFVRTRERSPAVVWAEQHNVGIRFPGAGDDVPAAADIV
jgi:hypothetical protein